MKKMFKNLNKSSLLIFVLPLIGYLYAYIFELGYLRYFKLSKEFVYIDMNDLILIGVLAILSAIAIVALELFAKVKLNKKYSTHFKRNLLIYFSLIVPTMIYVYFSSLYLSTLINFLIIILLFSLACVILSLVVSIFTRLNFIRDTKKKDNGKSKNIKSKKSTEKKNNGINKIDLIYILISTMVTVYVAISIFWLGWSMAISKTNYLIIEGDQKLVVVTEYKDGFITTPLDNNEITPKYSYIEINEDTLVYIENIGRLEVGDIIKSVD